MSAVRYRCTSCGNLTRFDVVATRRTTAFYHFSVGGDRTIEDERVLDETIESVTCRWCGPAGVVEPIVEAMPADDAAGEAGAPVAEERVP